MKTPEDEAFDEMAKRQGAWGGGFKAKQAMAADKMQEDLLNYGTSWSQDGKRIDPMSVYKEQPAQEPVARVTGVYGGRFTYDPINRAMVLPIGMALYSTPPQPAQEPEMLTIAYQSGYHDGKKAALAGREWNFCERCGKRTKDLTVIHTCTPPQEGK